MDGQRAAAASTCSTAGANGTWWVDGPIFSTTRRGSRITTMEPGALPGRFPASALWRIPATIVFWALLGFLFTANFFDDEVAPWAAELGTQWWRFVVLGVAVVLMFVVGPAFKLTTVLAARYGQQFLAAVGAVVPIIIGWLVALVAHRAFVEVYLVEMEARYASDSPPIDPAWTLPNPIVISALILTGAVGLLVLLVALPFLVASARRMQRVVAELRANGTAYEGRLTKVDFRNAQAGDMSHFAFEAGFTDASGPRTVAGHMATHPMRVPLEGEPVVVRVAVATRRGKRRERILVEPDSAVAMRFDPAWQQYVVTADGGGG